MLPTLAAPEMDPDPDQELRILQNKNFRRDQESHERGADGLHKVPQQGRAEFPRLELQVPSPDKKPNHKGHTL